MSGGAPGGRAGGGGGGGPDRWGSAVVGYAGLARPQDLVGAMPLEEVFTPAERVRSADGRTLQHWAGRLAAKRAVLRLLGVPPTAGRLGQVEVLPEPTPACRGDAACLDGHPPAVRLTGRLAGLDGPGGRIRVSLSHTARYALAVALRAARLPGEAGRSAARLPADATGSAARSLHNEEDR
ncbi:phosphopantetheinyl transferase [Planomonospora sp. ID82291]|uniref:phosphopantetheinyl transferase n=1 Tax=Planomonospora sp. ID82291 TaxID=2738136 RepID=UPI0018C4102A|nr:phosphopantetheinyl transferase [Planomonospora sp. ID82291]